MAIEKCLPSYLSLWYHIYLIMGVGYLCWSHKHGVCFLQDFRVSSLFSYIGCYNKDCLEEEYAFHDPELDIDNCTRQCLNIGHTVAGLRQGFACICGHLLCETGTLEGRLCDVECDVPCVGNGTNFCGGVTSVQLYNLSMSLSASHVNPNREEKSSTFNIDYSQILVCVGSLAVGVFVTIGFICCKSAWKKHRSRDSILASVSTQTGITFTLSDTLAGITSESATHTPASHRGVIRQSPTWSHCASRDRPNSDNHLSECSLPDTIADTERYISMDRGQTLKASHTLPAPNAQAASFGCTVGSQRLPINSPSSNDDGDYENADEDVDEAGYIRHNAIPLKT